MRTWGYIKEATLMKLDMTEEEAEQHMLLRRFPFYANEALTYICSAIKPNYTFANVTVLFPDEEDIGLIDTVKLDAKTQQAVFTMPDDFISFGEDVNTVQRAFHDRYFKTVVHYADYPTEARDDDFEYYDYNKVIFKCAGLFKISYNARWFEFTNETPNGLQLDIPIDILDCLPSYIASQCFKVDDEVKSSILRNEFEMMLARIDVANPRTTKNLHIGGGW